MSSLVPAGPHVGNPARLTLRIFDDSGSNDHSPPSDTTGDLSPRITLSAFYRDWFLPIVLEAEGASEGTLKSYGESIGWWVKITGDPPIFEINEYTLATFKKGLKAAEYRRGKVGKLRLLGEFTISKHQRQVRTVLNRVGPTTDPERPGKQLLDHVPYLRVSRPRRSLPKASFSLEQARAIVAAAHDVPMPLRPNLWEAPPALFWRTLLLALFYTGLRIGTLLKLRWAMLDESDPAMAWFRIPGSITKTGKPIVKFVHPVLLASLRELRRYNTAGAEALIFRWHHWRRHIANRHALLQSLAGIPATKQLTPHAWRRTHATEMARLGSKHAQEAARRSLDHADQRTTSEFYCNIEAELIAQLPDIGGRPGDSRQRSLFT